VAVIETPQERGKRLRSEIEQTYRALEAGHALKRDNDVTAIVGKYIPAGSSFSDAEQVLSGAGCKVSHRPAAAHTGPLRREDDIDGILVLSSRFAAATKFIVVLTPKSPGDYTTIGAMRAAITVATL
jgi:hypothetical protein